MNTKLNKHKSIGICIPTYKRPDFLKRCLESIFSQSDPEFITVYVADDSLSDINSLVYEWAAKIYSNFILFKNKINLGIDANIENLLNLATTDYIIILGEDDLLLNGAIDYMLNIVKEGKYDYIFANYLYIDNSQNSAIGHPVDRIGEITSREFIEKYLWAVGFIGANIFSRTALLSSERRYIGTYFNHVGRLVNLLPYDGVIYMTSIPLVGNRADDISSFTWSSNYYDVLFGFEGLMEDLATSSRFSTSMEKAKYLFRRKFGYFSVARIMLMRSYGIYTEHNFNKYFSKNVVGMKRLAYIFISRIPPFFCVPVRYIFSVGRKVKRINFSIRHKLSF